MTVFVVCRYRKVNPYTTGINKIVGYALKRTAAETIRQHYIQYGSKYYIYKVYEVKNSKK